MKRIIVLFCVVLMLVSILFGCQKADVANDDSNLSTSTSSADQDVQKNTVEESLTEKLIREIDGAYAEESKLPESSTTAGMVELSDKYTEKWKQIADEYYNKIMEYDGIITPNEIYYSSDDLHTYVSNMTTNWEQYHRVQCENYVKTLQTIYADGTIVGPIFADYKYEMQKEWALQIVGIYEQLYIQ